MVRATEIEKADFHARLKDFGWSGNLVRFTDRIEQENTRKTYKIGTIDDMYLFE